MAFMVSKLPDRASGRAVSQGVHRHALRGPALLDLVPEGAFLGQGLDMGLGKPCRLVRLAAEE